MTYRVGPMSSGKTVQRSYYGMVTFAILWVPGEEVDIGVGWPWTLRFHGTGALWWPSSRRTVAFVVEVMGFERPEYLRGKEVTHPRMEALGTLCTMQA